VNGRVAARPRGRLVCSLLAMKTLAARAVRDADDLRFLLDHLDITTTAEVWAIKYSCTWGNTVQQYRRTLRALSALRDDR
jgi:hypothetical protein